MINCLEIKLMQLSFELTSHPLLLKNYYRIRESCFRKDLGLVEFNGGEDIFDRNGLTLVIKDGHHCVGGLRLTGNKEHGPGFLPVEQGGFSLKASCHELLAGDVNYCQWSRLVIAPEYRNKVDLVMLVDKMIGIAGSLGYSYAFFVSGKTQARFYKRYHNKVGYSYDVLDDIQLPVEPGFEGLPHVIAVSRVDQPMAYENVSSGQVA
jgi:hypothetical protein